MASATGIPQEHPQTIESRADEPLLGGPGAVTQKDESAIQYNVLTGTAAVAQAGIWVLAVLVWSGILAQPLMLFSAHPLLNSSALLLQVQATLILQPTITPRQKLTGTRVHYTIQAVSLLAFIAAFLVIEVNKGDHPHFTSPHGVLGLITYIFIILQASVGVVQYFFPVRVLGSVDAGKKIYKYHRVSGYVLLVLELGTVIASTQTTFNLAALHIPLWGVVVTSVLIVAGVGARVKKHKLACDQPAFAVDHQHLHCFFPSLHLCFPSSLTISGTSKILLLDQHNGNPDGISNAISAPFVTCSSSPAEFLHKCPHHPASHPNQHPTSAGCNIPGSPRTPTLAKPRQLGRSPHERQSAIHTLAEENRQFRGASREERTWIRSKFGEGDLLITGWLLCIETAHPPQPIPPTCGAMPITFVRPGEMFHQPIPTSGYSNPRVPDPCPTVWWPRMTNPSKSQITEVLTAIADLANVTAVNFLPAWAVFELETGDDRNYELASLPGIVAGRTALYHHGDMPFAQTMRSRTRPRIVDPTQTLADGTIVQDNSNYLRQSALTPGCRVESGPVEPGTLAASVTAATTCGIKMRNLPGEEVLTVANHTPAASVSFTNSCYFQATPPTRLLEGFQVPSGSWSEVDGMSSGLFSLMKEGCRARRPQRPIGHPEVNFTEWHTEVLFRVFGNVSSPISDGVCGAPIVDIESGGVVGLFHLSDGVQAYSAELDDLVAEGWGLV